MHDPDIEYLREHTTPTRGNTPLDTYAKRIKELEDERREIHDLIAEAYAEAKSEGINPRALRRAIKIASMDKLKRKTHDDDQLDLETYLAAMGA